ncbi:asparagine synthase (glutamine-hydrolyzing) [Salegentibacter flavus]|uniref:asparagine synthase (glutamine-hydrolyzing) n=1 Tax=Salegentibacter flavus TaxID=287099 RepID=A0A1I4Y431_9FLAO|nr:asparagine synthase (glutamine-hydrolyzing) [Salegentibacter flavus]SFN32834.1 asparagine synthase (glutamine-hydrolysing) [Salegentibacter flavus]
MCGIAGIIGTGEHSSSLEKILKTQSHRGPDHTGRYIDKAFAALGHNRLSIIDLSPEAHQPFSDETGRFQLVFNGEIYNYKELRQELASGYIFRTKSDTEVLLAAFIKWGKACLQHLNGMFAFAIWDSKGKKLFAARDRFGVKPFYYTEAKGILYFASEIKALQSVIPQTAPNEKVWANYFAYGSYGMPDETFYKDIHQLPEGHFMEYSQGKLSIEAWYDFKERVSAIKPNKDFEEAKATYFDLLKDSIRLRFRADVPLGFNLSGGVDSSLLLALVNLFENKKNITAYSFYTGDERYDELPWVEQMIARTANPLKKVRFSAEEVAETAAFISKSQDEPFGGIPSLAYSKIFRQARQDGVKVLLDGQGMDEQWAGYDYYMNPQSNNTIQGTGSKSAFRPNVLNPDFLALAEKPVYPAPFEERILNLQYRDLFYTKIPRALRFNDRISMAYSTELREPFLDHRMVEFAFAQPADFKIHKGVQKYLLREILRELAPKELTYAPKRPLQTPQREWLGDELREFTEAQLEKLLASPAAGWFNKKELEKEWKKYRAGDRESSFHIWQWVNGGMLLGDAVML